MYLKYLVKAHFEVNGKYEGFPLVEELEKKATSMGMDVKDTYYNLLGYKADSQLSPSERFEYRKLSSEGNTKKLSSIFKLKDKTDLVEVLGNLECLSARGMVRPVKSKDKKFEGMIRLLSEYLLTNEEKVVWNGGEAMFYVEIIRPMKYLKNKKEFDKVFQNERFLSAVNILLPEIVYKKGCVPLITQGTFFVPFRMSEAQVKSLILSAVSHSIIRDLDVPPQVYFNLTREALNYQKGEDSEYLKIIDWSHSLGVTVKELFEMCGMKYVDRLEYFEKYKVIPFIAGEDKIQIFSANSTEPNHYIILTKRQTDQLVNTNSLRTLHWEGSVPHVYLNGKKDLRFILGVDTLNDFSVGGI